jgi:hypothetical protein
MSDTITTIDRATAKQLGAEVEAALREIAERHGLELVPKGGKFDPSVGTFKPNFEFKTSDSGANEFALYADMFGLDADDFGKEFTTHGKTFRISGIAPRSHVRPILATEVATGKGFKFTAESVQQLVKS